MRRRSRYGLNVNYRALRKIRGYLRHQSTTALLILLPSIAHGFAQSSIIVAIKLFFITNISLQPIYYLSYCYYLKQRRRLDVSEPGDKIRRELL